VLPARRREIGRMIQTQTRSTGPARRADHRHREARPRADRRQRSSTTSEAKSHSLQSLGFIRRIEVRAGAGVAEPRICCVSHGLSRDNRIPAERNRQP
jgi:hypothetical protein